MSDLLKIAARVKRVAIRLADASQCSNVRLTREQKRECQQLAEVLCDVELQLHEHAIGFTRQNERRAKKPFDPLRWLATNPINPEPSTREVQHA